MSRVSLVATLSLSLAAPGCAAPGRTTTGPAAPDLATATSQAKCGVRRSADRPLVVEWPAADRAALEARAQQGLVAVRYEGCEMEVLTGCEVEGTYDFVPLSRKQERVSIRDADELYARLPVGAASLEGKLKRSGQLVVDMTIVGRKQADRHVIGRDELSGRCDTATHVLTGLTVGAFALYTGSEIEGGASVAIGSAGAGGSKSRSHEILASDGDPARCDAGESGALGGCAALLRVEAVPLAGEPAPLLAEPTAAPVHQVQDQQLERRRAARKQAAWHGTSITSGVLAAASLGVLIGGGALLAQYEDDTFGVDYVPTDADQDKRRKGTSLLVAGAGGFLSFTALAVGAHVTARRVRFESKARVAPILAPRFAGLAVSGRF